jgi:hypothetical protein
MKKLITREECKTFKLAKYVRMRREEEGMCYSILGG